MKHHFFSLFHNYFLRYLFFTYLGFDDINALGPDYSRNGGRVLYVRDLSRGILASSACIEKGRRMSIDVNIQIFFIAIILFS